MARKGGLFKGLYWLIAANLYWNTIRIATEIAATQRVADAS